MKYLKITKSITDLSNSVLNKYFKDINKEPLLTKEEEIELARKAREGDDNAREQLVKSNLRFVISIAKKYQNQGVELIDLISEGNYGLIQGSYKYDERKGYRFISYAVWWIRQAIYKSICDNSRTIRIPITQINKITKVNRIIEKFESTNERPPSLKEIADLSNIPEEKIDLLLDSAKNTLSLDTPFNLDDDDEVGTLLDILPSEETIIEDRSDECEKLLKLLSPRNSDIVRMFFGIGVKKLDYDTIGQKFGITGERARQIKESSLELLRSKVK